MVLGYLISLAIVLLFAIISVVVVIRSGKSKGKSMGEHLQHLEECK